MSSRIHTLAREQRIRLRRYAGPVLHAEQLGHRLRVVHITDLHVGRVTPMSAQRAAAALTNAQSPDLVVMTGDFVAHSQLYLDALEEVIGMYEAPVVAVLGNHDHWAGAPDVRRSLRRAGAEVLDNAHTVITLGHERLQLVGVDDDYTSNADLDRAVRGLRRDLPSLGLSHIAEVADRMWRHHIPLVLSGHTHGGQITVARLHELAIGRLMGHRYIHGIYGTREENGAHPGAVYVSAGIGASVMPLRLGQLGQREVAVFELGALPGEFPEPLDEADPLPGRRPSVKKQLRRRRRMERLSAKRRSDDGSESP